MNSLGAPNFHEVFNEELWTWLDHETRDIRHIRVQGNHSQFSLLVQYSANLQNTILFPIKK